MSTYRTLTESETSELHAFAIETGGKWRDELVFKFWMKGLPVPGYPQIYGLRNSHGGEWLNGYKLPSDVILAIGKTDEFKKLSRPMQFCLKAAPFEITTWGGKPMSSVPGANQGATIRTVEALVARGFLVGKRVANATTRYTRAK